MTSPVAETDLRARGSSLIEELEDARRLQALEREQVIIRDLEEFAELWDLSLDAFCVGVARSIEDVIAWAEDGARSDGRSRPKIRFHHAGTTASAARIEGRFLTLGARRAPTALEPDGRYAFLALIPGGGSGSGPASSTSTRP